MKQGYEMLQYTDMANHGLIVILISARCLANKYHYIFQQVFKYNQTKKYHIKGRWRLRKTSSKENNIKGRLIQKVC